MFQQKIEKLALQFSGRHVEASVKAEARALEKMFRVYSGNYRKLCDLVRTTIVFSGENAVQDMGACIEHITKDPDCELIHTEEEKFRIDIGKHVPSGYRDVQLCMRLKTQDATALGLTEHFCEMQLHLDEMFSLKTENGHKNYIGCRNLRGN